MSEVWKAAIATTLGALGIFIVLALLGKAPAASVDPAVTVTPCGPIRAMTEGLLTGFGEVPVASGSLGNGRAMLMTRNEKTGSWTMLSIAPPDLACMIGSGDRFRLINPAEKGV
ncbi:hypothetical protein [Afifella sp. IM 167]|uniref:hypothetical protein n=1 Tax=Afifella sp. IM 167 TaxID=2033586 RepID=UPI001CCD7C26|nr:hypothetical protein [Afifella sp. IM 167]MBZ8133206.1 hypothetical protein [Afifella sp. IM 167]